MADLIDTLEFWHPVIDAAVTENYFPWAVVVRGSSADKQFRVRNLSYTYTAKSVTVSLQQMGIYSPTIGVDAQHYLSTDAVRFTATVAIGDLTPRATSARLTLRRVTAPDADLGEGEFQLLAHAGQWV